MNENELKALIKELMQPVYDGLVNHVYDMYKYVLPTLNRFPENVRKQYMEQALKVMTDGLSNSFNMIKPEEVANKIKEHMEVKHE